MASWTIFVFAGLWLWMRPGRHSLATLIGVGLLFGLASITKYQIALFLLPGLLLAWILDLIWYRQHRWPHFVVPGMVAGAIFFSWMYYSWFLLGSEYRDPAQDLETVRTVGSNSYLVFILSDFSRNLFALTFGEAFSGLFLPAMIFGLLLSLPRNEEGQRWGVFFILLAISTALFLLSNGSPESNRNHPGLYDRGISGCPAAVWANRFNLDWRQLRSLVTGKQGWQTSTIIAVIAAGFFLNLVAIPMLRAIYNVTGSTQTDPYQAADYLTANAAPDALIETWDKEMIMLSDHRYHLPPQTLLAHHNRAAYGETTLAHDEYDFRDYVDPDYVVIGPFSEWADLYTEDRLENYQLVAVFDRYEIYKRVD
jgi:hypothetical protein